jgi:hypothetical protein
MIEPQNPAADLQRISTVAESGSDSGQHRTAKPMELTTAERRQRQLAAVTTGAYARAILTDSKVRLTFLGVSRGQWARRIRGVGKANPHLLAPTGYVHPRFRNAIARLLLMQEVFNRLAASIDERGMFARSSEPARRLDTLRAYNREITRLEAALGVFGEPVDPGDPLAALLRGAR